MDTTQYELIRRIASVVGHELRNPLAVIGNSAYFVKTKLGATKDKDPKVEKHLGMIAAEIARADRMIADILAFSRPLEIKLMPVELAALVAEVLGAYSFPRSIKLKRERVPSGIKVAADSQALGDALRRILDNAVEAMAGKGTITVTVMAAGDKATIEIRDSGPGVKKEAWPTLFEPFFTNKPRGLGLGLAMARKSVEAHSGKIAAKNLAGEGAAFMISLPRV